jgi:hypothetical protein
MKTDSAARPVEHNRAATEFSDLPPDLQRLVCEFIAFLRTRRSPALARKATTRVRLATEGFVGMWRGRRDLRDSTAWVRRVRTEEWAKRG